MDGIAKFQALKFTSQGLIFPVECLVLLVRGRIPQKFQALKFPNSGPEIWRIHPPPFHTPPFACLVSMSALLRSTLGSNSRALTNSKSLGASRSRSVGSNSRKTTQRSRRDLEARSPAQLPSLNQHCQSRPENTRHKRLQRLPKGT